MYNQVVLLGTLTFSLTVKVQNHWSFKNYKPTPWESYTYDANDLANRTHSNVAAMHAQKNTPANGVVDALGRTVKAITGLDVGIEVVMKYDFDIQDTCLLLPLRRAAPYLSTGMGLPSRCYGEGTWIAAKAEPYAM